MSQSLVQIYVHLVFSTKLRRQLLHDADIRDRMHRYLAGVCRNLNSPALVIDGVADHVHILCRLAQTLGLSTLVRELKRESSKWIKIQYPNLTEFQWQSGYGAFSISPSHVDAVRQYIENQEDRHRTESFQDEFRRLCAKYGLAIDERYVWD